MLLSATNSSDAVLHLHHQGMRICPTEPVIHPQNAPQSQTEEEQREQDNGWDDLE